MLDINMIIEYRQLTENDVLIVAMLDINKIDLKNDVDTVLSINCSYVRYKLIS